MAKQRTSWLSEELPLLDDTYPYIVTRVVPSMYHVIPLPEKFPEDRALDVTTRQVRANKFQTCLVVAPNRAHWFEPRSTNAPDVTTDIPRGGIPVCDRLRAVPEIEHHQEVRARIAHLTNAFRSRLGDKPMWITGDLTKGSRKATPADIQRLSGVINGIPKGLSPCGTCKKLRGECLDTIRALGGLSVSTVHCDCDNDNLCA